MENYYEKRTAEFFERLYLQTPKNNAERQRLLDEYFLLRQRQRKIESVLMERWGVDLDLL